MAVFIRKTKKFMQELIDFDDFNIVPQLLQICLARQKQSACHVCGQFHEEIKPVKFCSICFSENSGNASYNLRKNAVRKYTTWHRAESGGLLCHLCYTNIRNRIHGKGIYDKNNTPLTGIRRRIGRITAPQDFHGEKVVYVERRKAKMLEPYAGSLYA